MVDHNDEFGSSAPSPEGGSEHLNYGELNPEAAVGDHLIAAGRIA